eukprot:Seg2376.3 transcript_id=Seg2376.3/GoldUCD/mRNA.D3Y31 product="DNA excision repair protein ERCC-8" protein_id=Seg2376.3/GoldUCD/D3Y31
MLPLLTRREIGLADGLFFRRSEKSRRAKSIQLSHDRNMEAVFASGVNSLDVEKQENRYLIAGSSQSKIAIYDTAIAEEGEKKICKTIATIDRSGDGAHKFSIEAVQWYPRDNGMFVTSSLDKSVKVWDSNTLQVADEFNFEYLIYCHHMSAVARKHCLIAVACDASKINLCDLKSGSSTHSLRGHKKAVMAVAWSTRSDYILASGGQDNRILIWDVRKASSFMMSMDQHNGEGAGRSSSTITAHSGYVNGLTFSSDGLHLLSFGADDRLRLWNVWTSESTLVNYGKICNLSKKHVQIAISKDLCKDIVCIPSEKDVKMFKIFSGKKMTKLQGHYGNVNCCYYNHSSQELYSGAMDNHVLIWSPKGVTKSPISNVDDANTKEKDADEAYQDAWSSDDEG